MMICRIAGTVHATAQDTPLAGKRLLLAQPLDLDGNQRGAPLIAVDTVDAGEGDLVLVMREGGGARIVLGDERVPVQAVVIAVVDDTELEA